MHGPQSVADGQDSSKISNDDLQEKWSFENSINQKPCGIFLSNGKLIDIDYNI